MSKPVNKTAIGIFVVIALALFVLAVLVLGSGKFFKNNPIVVMYFKGSVKGLSVGSPVAFRGVKVGSVTAIKMLFNPKDLSVVIPVYAELERGSLETIPGKETMQVYREKRSDKEFLSALIGRGMRGQLDMQSIVTGQLMVSLDFHPDMPAVLVGADPNTLEIPTIPTTLQQLAERVEKIPIEEIFTKLNNAMTGLEKIMTSPETAEMLREVKKAVEDTRDLVQDVDKQIEPIATRMLALADHLDQLATRLHSNVEPLAASIKNTSDEAAVTLKKAQATMGTIDDLAGEDSIVSYRLGRTLDEIGSAARALRLLADTLNHQPESVIFGKKNPGGK
jgi:paraquat-inducible protein B